MIKTFRYRIYPSTRQQQILNSQLAVCCELYNAAIQERRDAWAVNRKRVSWFDQNRQLSEIRKERCDVALVNARTLEDVLHRVHLAFEAFFRRVRNRERAGYPRFRSLRRYDSLTFRQVGVALYGRKLRLPKIGRVRINLHRPLNGAIKTLTVKREAGRWYALFSADCDANPLPFSADIVGVDVGLRSFATFSDGTVVDNPRWFCKAERKLRRLQRRVSRRQSGSKRRHKAVLLLQRFYNHVRNQRRDFHHKQSRKIVNANGLIAVEDLNVQGMASGMLAKSVRDAGWANFLFMLAYKAEEAGRVFVKVDPRGTSQNCLCGASVPKTLAMRQHICRECGLVADRDHVSAQLILARSLPSGANVAEVIACVA